MDVAEDGQFGLLDAETLWQHVQAHHIARTKMQKMVASTYPAKLDLNEPPAPYTHMSGPLRKYRYLLKF